MTGRLTGTPMNRLLIFQKPGVRPIPLVPKPLCDMGEVARARCLGVAVTRGNCADTGKLFPEKGAILGVEPAALPARLDQPRRRQRSGHRPVPLRAEHATKFEGVFDLSGPPIRAEEFAAQRGVQSIVGNVGLAMNSR